MFLIVISGALAFLLRSPRCCLPYDGLSAVILLHVHRPKSNWIQEENWRGLFRLHNMEFDGCTSASHEVITILSKERCGYWMCSGKYS